MTRGKRAAPGRTVRQYDHRAAAARAASLARARRSGKAVAPRRLEGEVRHESRTVKKSRLPIQMLLSAVILACIVAAKLTMPQLTADYGGKLLGLIGGDTDFVAVFSAVGRAIGGEEAGEAVEELCIAVFGSDTIEETTAPTDRTDTVYTAATTPARVELMQVILGFPYSCPTEGEITSAFGYRDHPTQQQERFHYGIDISTQEGAVIHAFADGTVAAVAQSTELGNYVELVHANGCTTLYAHCKCITASAGQAVKRGDPIAEAGSTGNATGTHLHFELCRDGVYLNPIYYVV